MPPDHRRRLGTIVALVLGGLAIALAVALVLTPPLPGLVDGLRALGGAGVDAPEEAVEQPGSRVPADAQTAVVDRVVDGDTIRVTVEEPGGAIAPTDSVRVRLLNVDAPELDHPDRGEDCGATEAAAFIAALTPPGSVVHLAADVEDRDVYDRPLRGVWNEHGVFVNAELVRAGWAEVVLFPPNDRFHDRLLPLAAQARDEHRGAWSVCGGFPP